MKMIDKRYIKPLIIAFIIYVLTVSWILKGEMKIEDCENRPHVKTTIYPETCLSR